MAALQYEPLFLFRRCWPPIVYELAGRRADADAALAAVRDLTNLDCYRTRGDVYDHRGEFAQAEHAYSAGVEHAPSLPQGYFSWGNALLRHQKYAAAIEKLAAANKRGPSWADPLEAWGEAADAYKQAIRINPDNAAVHCNLGEAYLALEQPQEALEAYKQAIRLTPNDPRAHYQYGLTSIALNDKATALDEFKILKKTSSELANKLFNAIYPS